MPNTVVRPYEPNDEEGFFSVINVTYNDGLPVPPERRMVNFADRYLAEVDGRVAGVFGVLPISATRGAATVPCGGVAGVAVAPDQRKGGIGLQMMGWLPRYLKQHGVPLASLYAFRETFYRKAGYEVCGQRLRLTVPSHRLPKVQSELPIQVLTPDHWQKLVSCYSKFAHERSGLHIRNEKMWLRVLAENKPLAIYALGDPIEAYVAVSHKVDFWVDQSVSEVVWSTRRGYEAAIAFLAQLGINKTSLSWYEPSDSPYLSRFMDQGVQVEVTRPIMFRMCDVVGGLQLLKPTTEGSFTFSVVDPFVPENEGPWKVEFGGGEVRVTPAASADFTMPIQQFAGAFLGAPGLATLVRQGLVDVANPMAVETALRLLPEQAVYCMDFF